MTKALRQSRATRPTDSSELVRALGEKIAARRAVVAVIGLGYVGLPLALDKANAGFKVIGIEKNAARREMLNKGRSYIADVPESELRALVDKKQLRAESDYACLAQANIVVIAVPTPITRNLIPDIKNIEEATRDIARHLRPGQLILLESTTFPGTTEEVVRPILEASGLRAERDFFLGYSPERLDPGNKQYQRSKIPRVVSGVGPRSAELARAFYAQSIERIVPVSSTNAAELVKIFENTFRAVNLALVNEFARLCDRMGLNVWEVLDAAFTKPYGIMPFYPGPGVGGHCTPVDPHYLEWKAKGLGFYTHFIDLAGQINRGMPAFVCDRAVRNLLKREILPRKAKALVLGVTYKKDVPDCRNSPAWEVIRLLGEQGLKVKFYDPYVQKPDEDGPRLRGEKFLTPELLAEQDLVLVLAEHSAIDYQFVVTHSCAVLDTRNATRKVQKGRGRIELL